MKTTRLFGALLVMAVVAACSPMFDVSYTNDPDADFKSYVTYSLMKNEPGQVSPDADQKWGSRRKVMQETLVSALNKQMQALGFKLDEKNPDILVAYYVGVRKEVFVANFGYDYAFTADNADVQTVQDGSMRIDLVDTEKKQVVWSGEGHGAVNTDPTEDMIRQNVDRAVEKIMKQYPPKKSSY